MFAEFRKFVLRGNVLDLAVAVVIGAAFGAVITSLVKDVLTPIIAAIVGQPDFGGLQIQIGDSAILYGSFLNTIFALIVVAAALFFFVVKPVNMLAERTRKQEEATPTTRECPECLSKVPLKAARCAFCASPLPA